MEDIRHVLNGIIVTANDIKVDIDKNWYKLFLSGNQIEASKKLLKYQKLYAELEKVGKELAKLRDIIYK